MIRNRIPLMDALPEPVKRAFTLVDDPASPEELLWREVATRMVLDALGYTGAADEKAAHDALVMEARTWFMLTKDAQTVFDLAGIDFPPVRTAILNLEPV